MALQLITPPIATPLMLDEIKLHLRVDATAEDALIRSCLQAAVDAVEQDTGRQLVTATWQLTTRVGREHTHCPHVTRLPKPPKAVPTVVEYLASDNTWQELDDDAWMATADEPALFYLLQPLPHVAPGDNLRITYTAGYGSPEDVPEILKMAIKLLAAEFYRNREASITGVSISPLPFGVDRILSLYRVMEIQ